MEYYYMKQKSSLSSNTFSYLTGKCTNDNIIVNGEEYSDDLGATWSVPAGNATAGESIYIDGNTVYKLFESAADVFQIWKSADSGATFAQLGGNIDLSAETYEFKVLGVIGDAMGEFALIGGIHDVSGDIEFRAYKIVVGAWNLETADTMVGMVAIGATTRRVWYDAGDTRLYFINEDAFSFLVEYDYTGQAFSVAFDFENFSGANDLNTSQADDFIQISTGVYLLSGHDTIAGTGYLVKSATVAAWSVVATEEITPVSGTGHRVWGFKYQSDQIYLSHDQGSHFFYVAHKSYNDSDVQRATTWSGAVEIVDSDRGLLGTDNNPFPKAYTFQEAIFNAHFWEPDLMLYNKSSVGEFNCFIPNSMIDRFPDDFVIQLWDDSGDPLFTGRKSRGASLTQEGTTWGVTFEELKIEFVLDKPRADYAAQTVAEMFQDRVDNSSFHWRDGNIASSATTYNDSLRGSISVDQKLDEWSLFDGNLAWRTSGDCEVILDDGTTASGTSYDADVDIFLNATVASEGRLVANRVIVIGTLENDGPVLAVSQDDDLVTRYGAIVKRLIRPTMQYTEAKALADEVLAARKAWSNVITITVLEDLTLRPGTTFGVSNFDTEYYIDDGTYLLEEIQHPGDGATVLTLNNTSIRVQDWRRDRDFDENAVNDDYGDTTGTESTSTSLAITPENLTDTKGGIYRFRTSEAQAWTLVYDAANKVLGWVDASGNFHLKPGGYLDHEGNLNKNALDPVDDQDLVTKISVGSIIGDVTAESTGFPDITDSTIAMNGNDFEISPAVTTFDFYSKGVKFTKDATQAEDLSGYSDNDLIYVYFDTSGAIQSSLVEWLFTDGTVFIATVYIDGDGGYVPADERHGVIMDGATHAYLHFSVNTRWERGMQFTVTAVDDIDVTVGYAFDEDFLISVAAGTPYATFVVMYRDANLHWLFDAPVAQWVKLDGGGDVQYDNAGALADANNWVPYWFFATNMVDKTIIAVVGQTTYVTEQSLQDNASPDDLSLGTLPSQEFKLLYMVPVRVNSIVGTPVDYRKNPALTGGNLTQSNHLALSGLAGGTYLDGGHTYLAPVHIEASTDPTVNDDIDTYKIGTIWIRSDNEKVWVCTDNADGAAVWVEVITDTSVADSKREIASWGPIAPLITNGWNGFVDSDGGGFGAGQIVAMSDAAANVAGAFRIQVAGTYNIVMQGTSVADNGGDVVSGKMYAGAQQSEEESRDINGENSDFPAFGATVSNQVTATHGTPLTCAAGDFVHVEWVKDDNAGGASGNFIFNGMTLERAT